MRWFLSLFLGLPLLISRTAAAAIPAWDQLEWPYRLAHPASIIKHRMVDFHDHLLLWVILGICLVVAVATIYIMLRFNHRANPVPARFSHNVPLEIIWTIIPTLVLLVIAVPSFKLLYYTDREPAKPELTIKVTGHQWYWEYEYPDSGPINFNSNMLKDNERKPGQPRLLEADNHLVIPVNTNIQILITAADVIHGFFIPAFGANKLGIPGRVNEIWLNATETGTFYGQCSKICGLNHGYMPIDVDVVTKEQFQAWLIEAKKKYAAAGQQETRYQEARNDALLPLIFLHLASKPAQP